ncbi:MAG: hypothetical protein ACKPEA_09060, partial [Planctomycetota bacterium]
RDLRLFGGSLYKRTHFAGAAVAAVFGFATLDPAKAREVEAKFHAGRAHAADEAGGQAAAASIESANEGAKR